MTVFYLIRHAKHNFDSAALAGRLPNVHLSPEGKAQAVRLAERLANAPLKAIYCSPMERTIETAHIVASKQNLSPQIYEELTELDFGEWQGQQIDDLREVEQWRHFNTFRSGTRAPNGELMLEAQARIICFMQQLRERHRNEHVALVSHSDVLKSAIAYYLGVHLDMFQRIEITPASVSIVAIADYGPRVLCVNHTGDELPSLS
jgi:probable phosphoglycerate mutase